jgi:hypothetical protein
MAERNILRGDSFQTRRPLFEFTLVDDQGAPFNLTGCTVMTTYKPQLTTIEEDPNDESAEIKREIQIDGSGDVVYQNGLFLASNAAAGVLYEHLTAAESAALSLGIPLHSDVQLIDSNGEVFTWLYMDSLVAAEAATHREPTAL